MKHFTWNTFLARFILSNNACFVVSNPTEQPQAQSCYKETEKKRGYMQITCHEVLNILHQVEQSTVSSLNKDTRHMVDNDTHDWLLFADFWQVMKQSQVSFQPSATSVSSQALFWGLERFYIDNWEYS